VEAPGFRPYTVPAIPLGAGQKLRLTAPLELGAVADTVTIAAQPPLVNAVSPEQRQSISELEVKQLPLARRDVSNVIALGSGIQQDTARGNAYVMNGLGKSAASITMDGIDASASPELPQTNLDGGFNYIGVVSLEAVEEVQVTKGVFAAEYARALSGNVNVITKSGTNELHGSLFESFISEELNARNQLLANKPGLTFNQFGGSLGGPVLRNKIFLFGAYEAYRERSFSAVQGDVPSQLLRDMLVARVPAYQQALDYFVLPNQSLPNPLIGRYVGAGSLSSNADHFVVKPDVWLWSGGRLRGTYIADNSDRTIPRISP
jgi:outer membrane receptor protein involved in Fe transport